MEPERINYLIEKYISGKLAGDEHSELYDLLIQPENRIMVHTLVERLRKTSEKPVAIDDEASLAAVRNIVGVDKPGYTAGIVKPMNRARLIVRWAVAASVIFFMATGSYLWFQNRTVPSVKLQAKAQQDIPAGKTGAILILADGSKVVLDSLGNGVVAQQNGSQVMLKSGQLAYDASRSSSTELTYNVLNTPKGRQFQLVLPDGTKVWLNSASSLKYPTTFSSKDRRVQLSGEAYFEVSKAVDKPFILILANNAEVKVLGTSFNVNAYDNESKIKATLLEGSVNVTASTSSGAANGEAAILKPRQQAQLTQAGNDIAVVSNVDVDKVVAWKNGVFNFEGVGLTEMMKQLERWYDIEVVYEGEVPNIEFYGELSRNNSLNDVIAALKDSDVHFRREGRKLIVFK
ncbi:FecR family protein [Pinibacter aurantiacus]|uniref:FecR domain-containing protein n=1 Tax=Pinibacter aurantiacus TaxID=2851599 RepID=A0A9E2S686_9BACT|nr:FecR family protein [Pinibacter aurantiacus]MBV4356397.1 FecR domain-containing protein [Pinibacter aurantiacus]